MPTLLDALAFLYPEIVVVLLGAAAILVAMTWGMRRLAGDDERT